MREKITVEVEVNSPVERVWEMWNTPKDIIEWTHASDDWHTTSAENDLKVGGKFKTVMAARDGSAGFDFEGVYTEVIENKLIEYTMSDGRTVKVEFIENGDSTKVIETFDPENENSEEMQRDGWQSILNNFKKYVESV